MPIVTSIRRQKGNLKRLNIYLDGKFGFGVDLENFVKLKLKVEQELDSEEIARIIKQSDFQKILDKLINFTTLRPRSKYEIERYLLRKKVPNNFQVDLMKKLVHLELVDDEKFALWWIEQRNTFRPKGKSALRAELASKGVDREVIDSVLSGVEIDEVGIATEILKKVGHRWQNLQPRIAFQKKVQYLGRRGFSWETIKEVVGTAD